MLYLEYDRNEHLIYSCVIPAGVWYSRCDGNIRSTFTEGVVTQIDFFSINLGLMGILNKV